jgi:radical SAM family uncharacterized protein
MSSLETVVFTVFVKKDSFRQALSKQEIDGIMDKIISGENIITMVDTQLETILNKVQKPGRYLGNEWNSCHKDHDQVRLRMALAFPDLYEVGMSNQGIKILYDSVNQQPDLLVERVFAPAVDMEEQLRAAGLPLFALESGKPLCEFDLIGFSLQYELSYTNVLNMLDLAGIPLYSENRVADDYPLIIGGGPCSFNPEPLAPFFDFFMLGESEETLPTLLQDIADLKSSGFSKSELLVKLSSLSGVYVPVFYRPRYNEGVFSGLDKLEKWAPDRIGKNFVMDLDSAPYPTAPVIPYIQTAHDRAVVEIFRGCARGCRFCQAGYIFKPVRRRSPEKIVETTRKLIASTGYDELSLSSLSSSDYPGIDELIHQVDEALTNQAVRCSLPSLRLDSYSVTLAEKLHQGRRSSLTFAPEAATERLRKVIGKRINEKDIYTALHDAVEAGWQGFKLYFMIGLPTEEEADVTAIAELCRNLRQHFRRQGKYKIRFSVSVATFVPKAHSPFQWEPQLPLTDVIKRQQLLIESFRKMPWVDFSWHDPETSLLEAVFARGDRRLALLLEKAWSLGCKFDGWSEYFSYQQWLQAFSELKIDPADYANRSYSYDDPLPWDHLDCGVDKDELIREHRLAFGDQQTEGSDGQ